MLMQRHRWIRREYLVELDAAPGRGGRKECKLKHTKPLSWND